MSDDLLDVDEFEDELAPTITQGSEAYLINGEHYDRISNVLNIISKPGLDKWKRDVGFIKADQILKEASALGTDVHAICERINRGQDPWPGFTHEEKGNQRWIQVEGSKLEPYYLGYSEWFRKHIRQIILIETTVWSTTHGFAGTFDTFAELSDFALDRLREHHKIDLSSGLTLLDNKTSKYLSWTYRLQTAAYEGTLLEQRLMPCVDVRGIVHLSSKMPGSCRLVPYEPQTDERDWNVWLGVLDTYRMSKTYEDDWKS